MSGCFVRALWGDELIDRWADRPYEVAECRKRQPQPEPSVLVAFGQQNADMAREAGWEVILASEEPVVNLTGKQDRNAGHYFGSYPWGITMYAHKFLAVAAALDAGWGEVVFLDLETAMLLPLPDDFWQVLGAGQRLQCPLYCYHNKRYKHHERPRTVASAPAFYCRDASVMDECLAIAKEYPNCTEEVHMRLWMDRQTDGWKGENHYVSEGYQFPYHEKRHGMLISPLLPLFGNQNLKGWSTMRKQGVKAWQKYVDDLESK